MVGLGLAFRGELKRDLEVCVGFVSTEEVLRMRRFLGPMTKAGEVPGQGRITFFFVYAELTLDLIDRSNVGQCRCSK